MGAGRQVGGRGSRGVRVDAWERGVEKRGAARGFTRGRSGSVRGLGRCGTRYAEVGAARVSAECSARRWCTLLPVSSGIFQLVLLIFLSVRGYRCTC